MKKIFCSRRYAAALLTGILMLALLGLTGCGQKMKTLTYKGSDFKVTAEVPEDGGFKFKDDAPKALDKIVSDSMCEKYLVGGGIVIGISSGYYTSNTGSFDAYKKFTKENHTLTGRREVEFAGRNAIRSDYRYGFSPAPLYGYTYTVDASDIRESLELTVYVLPADGKKDEIKELMKDEDVKAVIESMKIEKL